MLSLHFKPEVLIVAKCNVNIGATVTYNAAISY